VKFTFLIFFKNVSAQAQSLREIDFSIFSKHVDMGTKVAPLTTKYCPVECWWVFEIVKVG